MHMSERLLTVAEASKEGRIIIDVGTDHAYVPIYIARNYNPKLIYATDINHGPLKIASQNIKTAGLSHIIKTRLSNGLKQLSDVDADTVIIAGMGGKLIEDIVLGNPTGKHNRYVLSPMKAVPELRQALLNNGFKIVHETLAREDKRYYNIMIAQEGIGDYSPREIYLGRLNHHPLYNDYIQAKALQLEQIAKQISQSKSPDAITALNQLRKLINNLNILGT